MSIPRQFHFVFGLKQQTAPFHLAHYICLKSCLEVNRPQQLNFHYEHKPWGPLWDLIEPSLTLRPIQTSSLLQSLSYPDHSESQAYRYAHISDFFRLAVLNREGGIYADMDTLFIRHYPDSMYENPFVMGRETVDPHAAATGQCGSLCNALFMAEPGSTFGKAWLDQMGSSFDGSWSRHSTFLPYELSQSHPQTIQVEPESSFFFLDWTWLGIKRLFESSERLPEQVYSLHLWAHLWWAESRTDVSRFHAERLTPEYILYANTTYAQYARRFLPAGLPLKNKTAWQINNVSDRASDLLLNTSARITHKLRTLRRDLP